jgi:hypothetical protein
MQQLHGLDLRPDGSELAGVEELGQLRGTPTISCKNRRIPASIDLTSKQFSE